MKRNMSPGYCVVEIPGTLDFQARQLFRNPYSTSAKLFMKLNADTPWLKAGQILVVADSESPLTNQMLQSIKQIKWKSNNSITYLNSDEASFLQKNHGLIAGLITAGDKIFGTTGDIGEKYFSNIEQVLKKIELSYQNQFRTQGTLISQQFFIERNLLLNQLKSLVNKPLIKSLSHYAVKFRPYDDMKRALNLSSRSIVHEWSTIGLGGIPGYSNYVDNAAKAARFLKAGGYIGIGFSFSGASINVFKACTDGRENECGKVAFHDYSKFAISTTGGILGGVYGGAAMLGVCAFVGVATAGIGGVACAAVGSIAGGYLGSTGSEALAKKVIEYYDN